MQGACDYSAIHTGKISTAPGGLIGEPLSFTLGSNAVLDVHSILTFTIKVEGSASLFITINDHNVANYTLSDYFGTLNKIVGANVLRHGKNDVRFDVKVPSGAVFLYVEDVALWWFKNSLA
jgi:hypothetical protein